ncbi:MAG: hypothetical protein C4551_01585 [Bacillota bacterium]|nr:MAG: hypothetical protein C4551_01585 [Bacillota bacterium]
MAQAVKSRTKARVWMPSDDLSPRVRKLREEYFSFYDRDYFRNEVIGYTTGAEWDMLYNPVNWGVVPEVLPFVPAMMDTLLASAVVVKVPDGFWRRSIPVRKALFFNEVLNSHLPVRILEGELVVGAHFSTALSRCLDRGEGQAHRKAVDKWYQSLLATNAEAVGNTGAVPGHLIPDYPKVLRLGFAGIKAEIEEEASRESRPQAREFLEALALSCDAPRILSERYAAEAERLAEDPALAEEAAAAGLDPDTRRAELLDIARICRKVPWIPPETFHEAVQALWMTHMLIMAAESYPGAGLSHGRIDQYLYPYYKADIEAGRLTRERATELLECYFVKHNYAYDFQGRLGANQGINSSFGQLITIGGCGSGGEDASNELTWIILDVIEKLNMLEPKPNVRLHERTPDALLDRIVDMVAKCQGAPFLLNFDENSIAGLRWQGLPEDRLWDYAPVGCLENTLQGDDRSGTVDVNLNLAKAVELALNNGTNPVTGHRLGPATGRPETWRAFEEFYAAVKTQLKAMVDRLLALAAEADRIRATWEPTPYLSTMVGGCIEKRRDVSAGGPNHNYITVEGVGLATLADSVAAVKKLVYDEGRVKMAELLEALASDFDKNERLRQTLVNHAPKYGNDDPYVDEIAHDLSRFWTEEVFGRTSPATGRRFRGGYLSWNYWIAYGPLTGATPDGRKKGRFLSNGICPSAGRDAKGPTAVAQSVGTVGLETAPNGASHTMSFSQAVLRDPEHRAKFAAFLRGYGKVGGTALQINIIDPETLREAQKNPAEYANLLVRVTGYNAYFVTLGKAIQDEIIARESHAV